MPRLEAQVRLTNTGLYPQTAELAHWVLELYGRLGQESDARSFVAGLRAENRRKPRFMAELDRVGLGG